MPRLHAAPSRKFRDLLWAGGAYLLALGGGVLIGSAVAIVFVVVGSVFLAIVAASTDVVQRRVPGVGKWPLVEDAGFKVVADSELRRLEDQLREVKAQQPGNNRSASPPVRFEEIKPQVEGYLDEARAIWTELSERPPPDRVGTLYDEAIDWERRVAEHLDRYHSALAREFKEGGYILSPQLRTTSPTDRQTLQVCVERRGQVLRNFLDGTPGQDLDWTASVF